MWRNSLPQIDLLGSSSYAAIAGLNPLALFAAGEQGYWLDPSDFSTMFQDTAGATPVTAVGQSVRRWLDKSGRGNHFTQSSTSNAPILGRNPVVGTRNLLTRTEEFDNAAWTKNNSSITANAVNAPDGTTTADKLVENTALATHFARQNATVSSGVAYTLSVYAKAAERSQIMVQYFDGTTNRFPVFSLTDGTKIADNGIGSNWTSTSVGNGWWRFTISVTSAGTTAQCFFYAAVSGANSYTGDGTSGIFIWGAQLETGSTATAYQRVGSAFDVTQAGVQDCYYLAYDGTDDWLQSSTITPGTDKVQVFAGVRKLSDAATAIILESSINTGSNNGAFYLLNQTAPSYSFLSKGTTNAAATANSVSAPLSSILTGLGDISGDSAILRVNGTQAASSTADQGTGNYLAYPHYIGRRGGTLLPFNGRIYQLICRFGSNLTAAQIQQVESFVNSRTGAY